MKIFGVDGMDGILNVENFDKSLAEGVMLLTPFSATGEDEATVKFVKAYGDANNGETPNQFAADAYDVLYAMQAAKMMLASHQICQIRHQCSNVCFHAEYYS